MESSLKVIIKKHINFFKEEKIESVYLNKVEKMVRESLFDEGIVLPKNLSKIIKQEMIKSLKDEYQILYQNPFIMTTTKYQNPSIMTNLRNESETAIKERDLHHSLENFLKTKNIIPKTIYHEKSLKSESLKWLHPDVVGYKNILINKLEKIKDASNLMNLRQIEIYSYEIKKTLKLDNLRNYYYQAVSNSSWANYGYLAVQEIDEYDSELLDEVKKLNIKYKIGLIKIDKSNFLKSKILVKALLNENLDIEHIGKLMLNPDFENFIEKIKINHS